MATTIYQPDTALRSRYSSYVWRRTVLVVHDEDATIALFVDVICNEGYCVDVARDRQATMEYLTTRTPGLVLVDLATLRPGGFQIVEELRRRFPGRELPIVLIAADDRLAVEAARLDVHLVHPPLAPSDIRRLTNKWSRADAGEWQ